MQNSKVTSFILMALIIASACGGATDKKNKDSEDMSRFSSDAVMHQVFCDAALQGNSTLIEKLILSYDDINAPVCDGRTALMLAAFNGHTDILKVLLNAGAKADLKDELGRTALMYASTGPFPEAVKLLLTNGADPNIVDEVEKFTPLMFAAAEGQLEVVSILLANKADPALKDKDGDTAETFARQNGHDKVADMLSNYN
jgi:uncharacterized protein